MATKPDIQYFAESGEWAKPAGAVRVDMLLQAAGAGGAIAVVGSLPVVPGRDGEDGGLIVRSFPADELPDRVLVEVGKGGRGAVDASFDPPLRAGDGADGYVLILTHVAVES